MRPDRPLRPYDWDRIWCAQVRGNVELVRWLLGLKR